MDKKMVSDLSLEEPGLDEPGQEDGRGVSRRRLLAGAAAGGVVAVAAGTGVVVGKVAGEKLESAMAEADDELARLQGLLGLYETLDDTGLDDILKAGLAAVALSLEGLELGANALRRGLDLIEEAVRSLVVALPSAHESILWLEERVSALASAVTRLDEALGQALEKAAGNPIAIALGDFANRLLDALPLGLGDKVRGVLDSLIDLVASLDDLILGINDHVLEPLREKWFSTEEDKGVGATLIGPLRENVLDPLEAHLDALIEMTDAWQASLVAPSQRALADRAEIREEIASYRRKHLV
jgi:hypothetical protein